MSLNEASASFRFTGSAVMILEYQARVWAAGPGAR